MAILNATGSVHGAFTVAGNAARTLIITGDYRPSNASYFDSSGNLQTVAPNVLRSNVYDPVTLNPLGVLLESASTNSLFNNLMIGAAPTSTFPTDWVASAGGGLSFTVSTGTEDNIPFVDFRISGTTTNTAVTQIIFNSTVVGPRIVAASGQTWTLSSYLKMSAGSTSGILAIDLWMIEFDASSVSLHTNTSSPLTLPGGSLSAQRFALTSTLAQPTTAFIRPSLALAPTGTGVAIDITIRVGLVQVEQASSVSSPILTSTPIGPITRLADLLDSVIPASFTVSALPIAIEATLGSVTGLFSTSAIPTVISRPSVSVPSVFSVSANGSIFMGASAPPINVSTSLSASAILSRGAFGQVSALFNIQTTTGSNLISTSGSVSVQAATQALGVIRAKALGSIHAAISTVANTSTTNANNVFIHTHIITRATARIITHARGVINLQGTLLDKTPSPHTATGLVRAQISTIVIPQVNYAIRIKATFTTSGVASIIPSTEQSLADETIITQYQVSPTIRRLIEDFEDNINPELNLDAFYNLIWNWDSAQGYGLDVWGRIVGISRVLKVAEHKWFGFNEATPLSVDPYNQSPYYSGQELTPNYILDDEGYLTLIKAKALANIWDGSIPGLNKILLTLFGAGGNVWVQDNLDMTMAIIFGFNPTPLELSIVSNSGVIPKPTGVSLSVQTVM